MHGEKYIRSLHGPTTGTAQTGAAVQEGTYGIRPAVDAGRRPEHAPAEEVQML